MIFELLFICFIITLVFNFFFVLLLKLIIYFCSCLYFVTSFTVDCRISSSEFQKRQRYCWTSLNALAETNLFMDIYYLFERRFFFFVHWVNKSQHGSRNPTIGSIFVLSWRTRAMETFTFVLLFVYDRQPILLSLSIVKPDRAVNLSIAHLCDYNCLVS